jgi:hypothetical protein
VVTTQQKRSQRGCTLRRSTALLLVALGCAAGLRPLTDEDVIAGARALDTTYRVKDLVRVAGPKGSEFVLPVGEYRPSQIDAAGVLYAAPTGVLERAGFSKHAVQGGVYVENTPGHPYLRPSLWIERGRGKLLRIPLPASALRRYGDALVFAVDGKEQTP